MSDFLIQNIPADVKKDYKTACAHFKKTMRQDLLDRMAAMILVYKTVTGQLLAEYDRTKKKDQADKYPKNVRN